MRAEKPENICRPAPEGVVGADNFDRKLQLLDHIGMPFAPKHNQDLQQPKPEDPGPVHPGANQASLAAICGGSRRRLKAD